MHTKLHQRVYPNTELSAIILFPIFSLACVYIASLFCSFLCPPPPQKNISCVSHGLVSPLPIKLIITRSIGAKLRAIAVLPAAPCSAAGGHEFAKLWPHSTRPLTQCVSGLTHSHGIAEIRETKMRKQLYLFSADPAAAKGAPLKSDLVFR